MRGDYKKHGMCRVDTCVMVTVVDLLSVSRMVQDRETTQKCEFVNLDTLESALDIQIKKSTLVHRFSII